MSADAESSADASLGYSREPDGDAEFAHELALALSHTPLPCSPPAGDAEFAHELALALSQPPLPCSPPAGDAEFARKLAEVEASSPSPPSGDEEYARELAEAASSPPAGDLELAAALERAWNSGTASCAEDTSGDAELAKALSRLCVSDATQEDNDKLAGALEAALRGERPTLRDWNVVVKRQPTLPGVVKPQLDGRRPQPSRPIPTKRKPLPAQCEQHPLPSPMPLPPPLPPLKDGNLSQIYDESMGLFTAVARSRDALASLAGVASSRGDTKAAGHLGARAAAAADVARQLRLDASAAAYHMRNPNPHGAETVDLHGMASSHAEDVVRWHVFQLSEEHMRGKSMTFVTGRGAHATHAGAGGKTRLQAAVSLVLTDLDSYVTASWDAPRGAVIVRLRTT